MTIALITGANKDPGDLRNAVRQLPRGSMHPNRPVGYSVSLSPGSPDRPLTALQAAAQVGQVSALVRSKVLESTTAVPPMTVTFDWPSRVGSRPGLTYCWPTTKLPWIVATYTKRDRRAASAAVTGAPERTFSHDSSGDAVSGTVLMPLGSDACMTNRGVGAVPNSGGGRWIDIRTFCFVHE